MYNYNMQGMKGIQFLPFAALLARRGTYNKKDHLEQTITQQRKKPTAQSNSEHRKTLDNGNTRFSTPSSCSCIDGNRMPRPAWASADLPPSPLGQPFSIQQVKKLQVPE
jgi:hypothetical protein